MDKQTLYRQNLAFAGTAGVSENNQDLGFVPAFLDKSSGRVEIARLKEGHAAGMHLITYLPADWAERCDDHGRVLSLKPGVIAGFVQDGIFYTREEVAGL
jgi:hypothetical protein